MEKKYDFIGRLSRDFPSQIVVDVTDVCNLECVHCPHPDYKKSDYYKKSYLDIKLNNKMVDEVAKYGQGHTGYIRYTSNGEPLMHPQIYDMLDYAVKNSGVFVTLTTNGTILNEKRVEKLLSSGLHMIDISIDAFKADTYSAIRVKGKLDVTQKHVLRLLELKKELKANTYIILSFIEQENNLDEAKMFEEYWLEKGADKVIIRRLHSAAGFVESISNELKKQHENISRYPCLYPWERITLNPLGELSFCPQDWLHKSSMVNYQDITIKELWQSDIYKSLRKAHLENNYTDHQFCGNCPDWAQTRWPGEGKSYADMVEEFI